MCTQAKACFGEAPKPARGGACAPQRIAGNSKRSFDFAQDDKLLVCERCSAQVGNDGGLIGSGQVSAVRHAANEIWPLIARIFCHWRQSVAFETAGDEKSVSILQLLGLNVIGARI